MAIPELSISLSPAFLCVFDCNVLGDCHVACWMVYICFLDRWSVSHFPQAAWIMDSVMVSCSKTAPNHDISPLLCTKHDFCYCAQIIQLWIHLSHLTSHKNEPCCLFLMVVAYTYTYTVTRATCRSCDDILGLLETSALGLTWPCWQSTYFPDSGIAYC